MNDAKELLAALQSDISVRLRPVCGGLSDQSFEQLVREIAAFKLKYDADLGLSASLRPRPENALTESTAAVASSSRSGSSI